MASSSQVLPSENSVRDEDRRAIRLEVTKLCFAVDELNARVQWLQYNATRHREKFEVIRATTTTMLAEGLCSSTAEAQHVLRTYANIIQEILRRP